MTTGVAVVSGGMDSTCLAYMLKDTGDDLIMVSFDYGQKHVKELSYAMITANELNAEHIVVPMQFLGKILDSALTSKNQDVPEGHYADDNMRATVVPNRNAIMLSVATGIAVSKGADYVATGVHAGDHPVYPDCRPAFISMMSETMQIATEGFHKPGFTVFAPFVQVSKAQIVSIGESLKRKVNWSHTWSCYKGNNHHCGKCGTCVERREAFSLAGVVDPTIYE